MVFLVLMPPFTLLRDSSDVSKNTILSQDVWHHFCFYLFSQNWIAFSKLHKPLFTEHGVISFPNTNPPLDKMNNAYCQVRKEFFAKALSSMLFTAFSLTDISLTYITVYIFKTLLVIYTLRNRDQSD